MSKTTATPAQWFKRLILSGGVILLLGMSTYLSPVSAQPNAQKPFILPFKEPPGPNTWLLAQPYGNTVGAFFRRDSTYRAGQGIHFGVDFSAPCGTEIIAIADGVVFAADALNFGSAPHNLMIDHPDLGYASFYGHLLERPRLQSGQRVRAGDVVALTGDPAETCYGRPHLHLEIRDLRHVRKYNPLLLMQADWDNLALIGPFGRAFERDLNNPRKWQHLNDQPETVIGGPLLNDFAKPWPPDSRQVLFIDKPASDTPVGIWGVDVTQPGSAPELITERIGFYTADFAFLVELDGDTTIVERLADGERWAVPAGGQPVYFSPDRKHIAWQESNDAPFERRITQVWVANLDGSDARPVAKINRGGFAGWISDDILLLNGHESLESREEVLYTLSLSSGNMTELVRAERLRGELLSPDGNWLAYFITFNEDPAQNGLWLVRTDGSERRKLERDLFGAYQWHDARRLLVIPFPPEAESHELWEYDVETGQSRRLTDPDTIPFKVANGDWQVSPDGRHVAFVESRDHNIWLLSL